MSGWLGMDKGFNLSSLDFTLRALDLSTDRSMSLGHLQRGHLDHGLWGP